MTIMAKMCKEHYRSCPYNDDGWYCLHHGDVCDTWDYLQEQKQLRDAKADGMKVKYTVWLAFGQRLPGCSDGLQDGRITLQVYEGEADSEQKALADAGNVFGVKFEGVTAAPTTYSYRISPASTLFVKLCIADKDE